MKTHPRIVMAVISANKAKLKCRASVPKPRGQASGEFRAEERTGPARSPGFQDRSPGAALMNHLSHFPDRKSVV